MPAYGEQRWQDRPGSGARQLEALMLWTIIAVLLVLWLVGLVGSIGGSLINILLVLAIVLVVVNLVGGGRRRL
jgi:hypothetical protein